MTSITNKSAMDAIRQRRESLMGQPATKVTFEPWRVSGAPFVCYVRPVTLLEQDAISASRMNGRDEGRSGIYDSFIAVIVHRARNEDGSLIFSTSQLEELRQNLDPDDARELAELITKAGRSEEDIEGN